MNGNSSKQVLLSVLGIAVLVIAVVGVSFAFFSYSKTGEKNNYITAGTIFFQFTEGQQISLNNQFPIPDSEGIQFSGNGNALTFHVRGYDGSNVGINYTVTATAGNVEYIDSQTNTDPKTRLHDTGIKLRLTQTKGTGAGSDGYLNNYSSPAFVSEHYASGSTSTVGGNIVLATGKITAGSASQPQDDTYVLQMWISSDTTSIAGNGVSINENTGATSTEDNVYTAAQFANCYYSLRVDVNATATR